MNIILILLAVISVPAVLLTLYSKTEKGERMLLGSYFIIKNMASRIFRVRNLRDIPLLLVRMAFALLIALLIINPSEVDAPDRTMVLHEPEKTAGHSGPDKGEITLDVPENALDSFNEEIYFLESLARNLPEKGKLTLIYAPDEKRFNAVHGDTVIFPARDTEKEFLNSWSRLFYITELIEGNFKIKASGYAVKKLFRSLVVNDEAVSVYSELEGGIPLSLSFKADNRRVLLFMTGVSSFWGDAGLSGMMIEDIIKFQNNLVLADNSRTAGLKQFKKRGGLTGLLPPEVLVRAAAILLMVEILIFAFRSWKTKRTGSISLLFIIILLTPAVLRADGFRFIELDSDRAPNARNQYMFSIIKKKSERSTSVKIADDFYEKFSTADLAAGRMPSLPYLWVLGCKPKGFYSKKVSAALVRFIERGGIIFIDTCGEGSDAAYFTRVQGLALEVLAFNKNAGELRILDGKHPIYRSFFLLYGRGFLGQNISRSTRRTSLIISRGGFRKGILRNDETSVRTGINILLYMLSGNYKSDQIHTRKILRRLKKREFFK